MTPREKMLLKLQSQATKLKNRGGSFGKSFRPDDGKHHIRVLPGDQFKCTDEGIHYDLFQHWIKVEGKNRPFNCMARTGVPEDEINECNCPACKAWKLLTEQKEVATDADLIKVLDLQRKKLSFRSAAVIGVLVRTKSKDDDSWTSAAMPWSAPTTVAEQILTTVADQMTDDEELDPFNPECGNDWILTRSTDNNSTSYKISMKSKKSPLGEFDGELPNLDKHYKSEIASGNSEKNRELLLDIVSVIMERVFDAAAESSEDVDDLAQEWKDFCKQFKKATATLKAEQMAKKGDSDEDESPKKAKVFGAKETTSKTIRPVNDENDDDDAAALAAAAKAAKVKARKAAEAAEAKAEAELAAKKAAKAAAAKKAAAAEDESEDETSSDLGAAEAAIRAASALVDDDEDEDEDEDED